MLWCRNGAETVGAEILALEAERRDIDGQISADAETAGVIALNPAAIRRYLGQIDELTAAFAARQDRT